MICRRRTLALGWTLVGMFAACGCAKAPPPLAPPSITIAAPPDARSRRHDPRGERRYESRCHRHLADRGARVSVENGRGVHGADFFALFDDDQKVLGPELISRDEFVLAPAEQRTMDVTVSGETRFVGAIAAFRDIRNAQWRVLVPASRKGLTVAVERARILLTVAAN
jgi:predicted component of type VI protein secretion system